MVNLVDVPGYARPTSASRRDPLVGRDELGREIRMARNGVRYLATDIAPVVSDGAGGRGAVYNLLDNIIGYDDDVVTPGERLKSGVQSFVGGLLSDPLGTGADIVRGGYETVEGAMGPRATPMDVLGAAGMAMGAGGLAARPAGSVGVGGRVVSGFDVSRRDASNIFGEGSERVRYTDPQSGGTMEVVVRPDGRASVLELEVPEEFRGQGIGQSLQARVMQDFPVMGGQVSSRAAATTAYRLGRRPYGMPDATLDDVFRIMDEDSSVNLISPAAQPTDLSANRSTPTGLLAASAADTPAQQTARLLREGRGAEVTDDLYAAADPQELHRLYETGSTGADMPMDTPSRMQRAAEMRFDTGTPLYHGTGADFQAFDAGRFQQSDFGTGGAGIYSSGDAGLAGAYSDLVTRPSGDGANVLPIFTRRFDAFDNGGYRNINNAEQAREYSRRMQEMGVDNVYYTDNMTGEIVENTTFDPSNIRSRFARFDPRLAHLRNLNAANVDPTLGLLATQAGTEQDPLANLRNYVAQYGLLAQ